MRDLNDTLVVKLKEGEGHRGGKLRLDTTIVGDIHYPTDTSLLADGIRAITRTVTKLKKIVGRTGSKLWITAVS